MKAAHILAWSKTHRYLERCNDPEPLSRCQFCPDCIIVTLGYDFQEGQVQVREVCSIGHQTCRFDVLPKPMHRWQSRAQRQCVDPDLIGVHEPVGTNIKCFRTALDRLEGVRDIFCSPNFECIEFEISTMNSG